MCCVWMHGKGKLETWREYQIKINRLLMYIGHIYGEGEEEISGIMFFLLFFFPFPFCHRCVSKHSLIHIHIHFLKLVPKLHTTWFGTENFLPYNSSHMSFIFGLADSPQKSHTPPILMSMPTHNTTYDNVAAVDVVREWSEEWEKMAKSYDVTSREGLEDVWFNLIWKRFFGWWNLDQVRKCECSTVVEVYLLLSLHLFAVFCMLYHGKPSTSTDIYTTTMMMAI